MCVQCKAFVIARSSTVDEDWGGRLCCYVEVVLSRLGWQRWKATKVASVSRSTLEPLLCLRRCEESVDWGVFPMGSPSSPCFRYQGFCLEV